MAFGNVTTGTTASRPLNAGTNGNIYVISGDANTANNGRTYISDGAAWNEVTSNQAATDARYVQLAAAGVSSVGSISVSSNVKGATISGSSITLTPADSTNGGIVTIGDQKFSGVKTFNSDLIVNGLSIGRGAGNEASNVSNGRSALSSNTTGSYNTATGDEALLNNTTGNDNTANGAWALRENLTGKQNTATGSEALSNNTKGSYNTAIGMRALSSNTEGDYNTATGKDALYANTTGSYNTATGKDALYANTTGSNNTAIGREALEDNTTGSYNTAIGRDALEDNTTGSYNTAIGHHAGDANNVLTTGSYNTFIGTSANAASSSLENATALGYQALAAASNSIQLGNTSVTNVKTSGTITSGTVTYPNIHGSANQVLSTNGSGILTWTTPATTADAGTLNGTTLKSTVTGSSLTTVGTITSGVWSGTTIAIANGGTGATTKSAAFNALSPMTSSGDIIYGGTSGTGTRLAKGTDAQVLTLVGGLPTWSTAAGGVTSVGGIETFANTNGATISGTTITLTPANATNGGIVNIHTQSFAGAKTFMKDLKVNGLTIGRGGGDNIENVSNGSEALYFNTTDGRYNTATGLNALRANTTGDNNTANGSNALFVNITGEANTATGSDALASTTGSYNTATGMSALVSNTTGSNNTAIGYQAGNTLTTGSNNTFIGRGANPSSASVSNEITIGNSSIATLRAQVTSITALSDRRDKTDIISISEGLDFIKQLKPVSFTWNTRDKAKVGIKSAGFIAQDLLALQQKSEIGNNLDLVSQENPEKLEARYNNLLPVIVKAIQEESAEKDKKIADLEARLKSLEAIVNKR